MVGDTYVECMVKKKSSGLLTFLKVLLIVVTVFTGLLGLMGQIVLLIIAVAAGLGAYFVGLNANLEYEYLYVDKELSVDKIMAQTKRKRIESLELERMEIMAPIKSWHLDGTKNRNLKETDYSSGVENQPDTRYALIYNGDRRIIFEPNEAMVKAIQAVAPRKVFTD